jgi:hypothetical protein
MVSGGSASDWVIALATVVLVVLNVIYLNQTRQQVNQALGRDAKSMQEKRRRLLLICRRIDSVLVNLVQSDDPSDEPLWTDAEIQQLETLLPDFAEVSLYDASSVVWTLTQIRHHLTQPGGTVQFYQGEEVHRTMGGMDFHGAVKETRSKLLGIMDAVLVELNRTASKAV